jgi:mRNA-degrading endonuclease toxin of MazEF toxin-antitoxin module
MNRGEVYEYVIGSHQARIAIVSATPYNPRLATFAVIRHPSAKPPPTSIAVPTGPGDPVAGVVDVSRLRALDESAVRARLGRLTPNTLGHVNRALRTYLDL